LKILIERSGIVIWLITMGVLLMKSIVKKCDMVIRHFFYKDIKRERERSE
jgi:hypothetical protein